MKPYDHKKIEKKWQKEWAKKKIYKTGDKGSKFYILDMFPYPSGEGLHVGHPKGYIATDIVSRMKRMQGFNVLHPMGFDAFGLPAENYAIKMKTNPAVAVAKNVARYKKQLEILGFDYDWSREVITTDPKFYKWTQWIFLKLLEKGLAYESFEPVNWCPFDKTVLANEDVENGRCERCGTLVEKKLMRQWVLKITDYADRMLKDLDAKDSKGQPLLDWPESIKESQRNWIGRSEGAEIDFNVVFKKNPEDNKRRGPDGKPAHISVFTTRPDTLFGVTYIVLSPEHPWVRLATDGKHDVLENKEMVKEYAKIVAAKSDIERTSEGKEKTGIRLEGVMAVNPATGEEIPMYIADYVLADYGTGAVMAVPAHDARDMEFAQNFDLPVKTVIEPITGKEAANEKTRKSIVAVVKDPKTGKFISINWGALGGNLFIGGGIDEGEDIVTTAKREIAEETGYTDVRFISQSEKIHHHYIAHSKNNEPRNIEATGLYFELASEAKKEEKLEKDEVGKFKVEWLTESEILSKVGDELHSLVFKRLVQHQAYTGHGLLSDSGKFSGKKSDEAKKEMTEFAGGRWVTRYKLRDWVFSRQRYWGEPIPVIHAGEKGEIVIPVPEKDLPLKLPKVKSYEPTGTGESPLANIPKWVNVKVKMKNPETGKTETVIARRETNTMPQWAGSSWYYLRYMDPKNTTKMVDPKKEKYWNVVDLYVGGAEHATRHLIYARFWHKFLYDIGVVSTIEPFKKLQSVGLIMAEDGRKMSKRWGNVINPDEMVGLYGADTLRVYEMFMGPFDQAIGWNTKGMIGSRRFIERVWRLADKVVSGKAGKALKKGTSKGGKTPHKTTSASAETALHKAVKKVGEDIAILHFNTAVSTLMITLNELEKEETIAQADYEMLLKIMAPFAPHVADELWHELGNKKSIHVEKWPIFNPKKIVSSTVTMPVQVNGRIRATMEMAVDASESEVKTAGLELPEIKKWMEGETVVRVVFVAGKIINFLTKKA